MKTFSPKTAIIATVFVLFITISCLALCFSMLCLLGWISMLPIIGPVVHTFGLGVSKAIIIVSPVILGVAIIGATHLREARISNYNTKTLLAFVVIWVICISAVSIIAAFASEGHGPTLLALYSTDSREVTRVAELVPYDFEIFDRLGFSKNDEELAGAYVRALIYAFSKAKPEEMQIGDGKPFEVFPSRGPICETFASIGPRAKPAVPALINYLEEVRGHKYYKAEFDDRDSTVRISYDPDPPEDRAVRALQAITGQNFGTDVTRWRAWWDMSRED